MQKEEKEMSGCNWPEVHILGLIWAAHGEIQLKPEWQFFCALDTYH